MITETSFLGGKVIKKTLPQISGASRPDAPTLKRLILPQGELAQFYDSDQGIRYMAMIELHPGKVRGNHYHEVKEELVYVIEGKTELLVQDVENKADALITLEAGDLAIIQVKTAHALRPLERGRAIEFSPARFDLADIQRYPLT